MASQSPDDRRFMKRALELARRGQGRVHPNPMVGAVLVRSGRVIAEGFHRRFGESHAEINAIKSAKQSVKGATLYVNLEPCAHFGKTPPCAEFILKQGIKKLVVGTVDPNPLVSGKGLAYLKKKGVQVVQGVLADECCELNKDFFFWVRTKRPYVIVKAAQSLDGKIAASSGQSKWITGPSARAFSHGLRAECDAILVGVNTILHDDPLLSVRLARSSAKKQAGFQPAKIILDSRLRTPINARIFSFKSPGKVIIATTSKATAIKIKALEKKCKILTLPQKNRQVDLKDLFTVLGRMGFVKVMVEGGGETIASVFDTGLVKEAYFFVAPKIIGGRQAVSSVAGKGMNLRHATTFKKWLSMPVGRDLLIHGHF